MDQGNIDTTSWWGEYSSDLSAGETHRIELFCRSLAPTSGGHAQREQVFTRLEAAVEAGVIDSYDVSVVGKEVCLCENCSGTRLGQRLLEKLDSLRGWGGQGVEPLGFTERTVESSMTGERYRLLVVPEVSLGAYIDGRLRAVFPSRIEREAIGVIDYLDALEAESFTRELSTVDA